MSSKWSGRALAQRARDIVEAIRAIREFTNGMNARAYMADEKTQSAVERKLLVISEACIKIRDAQKDLDIPVDQRMEARLAQWPAICGIGNIIRHEYGRVNAEMIWKTVGSSTELNALERAITQAFDV